MNRYDEKVYRVPKRRDGPSLADQKGQLVRLKQDLEQYRSRQAGTAVIGSLEARIRDLEASVRHAEAAGTDARGGDRRRYPDDDAGDGSSQSTGTVRATSSRFPPRGTPGRTF